MPVCMHGRVCVCVVVFYEIEIYCTGVTCRSCRIKNVDLIIFKYRNTVKPV